MTKGTTDNHVKLVVLRQPGDVACVKRQCVQQQIGCGLETNAFWRTTVTISLDYLGATGPNWKGRM